MTSLVTGGAGFIGSMLCRRLTESGERVVVVDDLSVGRREHIACLHPQVSLIETDIRDAAALRDVFATVRPEVVYHLAAIHFIPYCNQHRDETLATNVVGTSNVLEACRQTQPEVVILASSAAVYAISDRPHGEETSAVQPVDVYGVSKLFVEELGKLYASETERRCVAVRIFNAVGPNETNPHLVPHLVEQLKEGMAAVALGNVEPCRDYINTRDLADALIRLAQTDGRGFDVFNVGSGQEHSVRQIVALCGRILGREIRIDQKAELMREVERMHLCASIEKITAATGWQPKATLQETLGDLLADG